MPLATAEKIPVFDPSLEPTADGASGLWWRESHVPVIPLAGFLDLVSGLVIGATPYPAHPLPGAMMASGRPAWIGLIRIRHTRSRIYFRLVAALPAAPPESGDNVFRMPGPDFTAAVEAALRIVIRYRTHTVTIALPVADSDPYNFGYPADQTAVLSALAAAILADLASDAVQPVDIALVDSGIVDVSDPADPGVLVPGYQERERALYPTEVALYALEITHPAAGTVRVVNDAVDHVLGGQRYVALRCDVVEATDADGEVTHAEIQVDNVGQEMTAWIERSRGGAGATVRLMRVTARSGEVEWDLTLDVASVRVDTARVYVGLGFDPLLSRPACGIFHYPDTTPGIF